MPRARLRPGGPHHAVMQPTPDALWTAEQVAAYLGVARSSFYRLRDNDPSFPAAIRLSAQSVRYRPEQVVEWTRSRQADGPVSVTPNQARASCSRAEGLKGKRHGYPDAREAEGTPQGCGLPLAVTAVCAHDSIWRGIRHRRPCLAGSVSRSMLLHARHVANPGSSSAADIVSAGDRQPWRATPNGP